MGRLIGMSQANLFFGIFVGFEQTIIESKKISSA